jgi:hypothetical protein
MNQEKDLVRERRNVSETPHPLELTDTYQVAAERTLKKNLLEIKIGNEIVRETVLETTTELVIEMEIETGIEAATEIGTAIEPLGESMSATDQTLVTAMFLANRLVMTLEIVAKNETRNLSEKILPAKLKKERSETVPRIAIVSRRDPAVEIEQIAIVIDVLDRVQEAVLVVVMIETDPVIEAAGEIGLIHEIVVIDETATTETAEDRRFYIDLDIATHRASSLVSFYNQITLHQAPFCASNSSSSYYLCRFIHDKTFRL